MYNGLKYAFAFLSGAAIASVATWKVLEKKYNKMIQEEVDAFKKYWTSREDHPVTSPDSNNAEGKKADEESNDATLEEFTSTIADYVSTEEKGGSETLDNIGPKVITPEEFGEIEEYDTISLTYFADGVLTDDMNEPIEDVEGTVGYNFEKHFGEYEDDSVFIRNHRLKADYEILADERKFANLGNTSPDLEDDE